MKQEKAHKIKLVKLLEILRQDSDEEHYISTPEILSKLAAQGIECDRRTLYDDVEVLNYYGYEILCEKVAGRSNKYCIADRNFNVPELRILMDAVQAASFITPKKTEEFIDKISALGGSHRAELLKKNIVNFDTVKHTNEQIFYSVDELERAILEGKKVSFLYFDYNTKREKIYRKNKERYVVNPFATVFSNDNYYLLSYNEKYNEITPYRIDRMANVIVEGEDRVLPPQKIDLKKHKKEVFGMFSGESVRIKVEFDKALLDPVMDKFGEDAHYAEAANGNIELIARVQLSLPFFAWVCSFGDKMKVTEPQEVVDAVKEYVKSLSKLYGSES